MHPLYRCAPSAQRAHTGTRRIEAFLAARPPRGSAEHRALLVAIASATASVQPRPRGRLVAALVANHRNHARVWFMGAHS